MHPRDRNTKKKKLDHTSRKKAALQSLYAIPYSKSSDYDHNDVLDQSATYHHMQRIKKNQILNQINKQLIIIFKENYPTNSALTASIQC